jgi:ketosteroid isomerase-like protein
MGAEAMKTTYAVILSVLLLLASSCAQKVNDPADVQAVKKSMEDYVKAVNAGDANAAVALMSDKAIYADNHFPVATGKEAIRSLHTAWNSQFTSEFSAPVEYVGVVGDNAVLRGSWTIKLTPKAAGVAPVSDSGSWIVVMIRQPDGSWKWDWCIPNSNQPLPGSTASGEDEQALYQLERDWAAASLTKDTAVVDKFLASEFTANWNGQIQNKKQVLAEMKASPAKIESGANSEMKALVFGDTAIVMGLYVEKSTTGGKDSSARHRYTEVYVKRDGRWQCVTQYGVKVE